MKPAFYFVLFISLKPYSTRFFAGNTSECQGELLCITYLYKEVSFLISGLTITQSKKPVTCTQHCEEMSLLHAGVIQYLGTQYRVCFGTHHEEHKTKNKKSKSKSQTVSVDKYVRRCLIILIVSYCVGS